MAALRAVQALNGSTTRCSGSMSAKPWRCFHYATRLLPVFPYLCGKKIAAWLSDIFCRTHI